MPTTALLLTLLTSAPPIEGYAIQLFKKGSAEYAAGNFAAALDDYTQAYEAAPVAGFLFNIGQCHRALQHWELASAFFRRYLTEKPGAKNAAEVRALIAEADAKPAVTTPPHFPPEPKAREPALQPVPSGAVALSTSSEPPERSAGAAPWGLVGAGAAVVVAGAILGGLALSIAGSNHPSTDTTNGLTRNSLTLPQANNANTFATVSLPLLVVGVGTAAAGLIWKLTSHSRAADVGGPRGN
jgi:tetratricopeptide (TPR) repeat protein